MRHFLAWCGIALMIGSIIWRESLPRPSATVVTKPGPPKEIFPVVVIDPGHGGQDSGAMCGAILEKDLTLDVAQRLERRLQAAGLSTVMTRLGDGYVSLSERASLTNRVPDCIFVSIHFNEGNKPVSSGIETYYAEHQIGTGRPLVSWLPFLQRISAEEPKPESQSLAGFIQQSLVTQTHAMNRGTKAEQFFVLANVKHPAVLVEGGFMTNKDDVAKLGSPEYREQMAAAIEDGITHYREVLKGRLATVAPLPPRPTE